MPSSLKALTNLPSKRSQTLSDSLTHSLTHSLVEHGLSSLLELTSTVHVANIFRRSSASTIRSAVVNWGVLATSDGVSLVNDHALVLLRSCNNALVGVIPFITVSIGLHARLLANDIEH